MFKIYFKDVNNIYKQPIIIIEEKDMILILGKYWRFVPKIMVTNSSDQSILEIEDGNIVHPINEKEIIEKTLNMIEQDISEEFDELIILYKKKLLQIQKSYSLTLEKELEDININLLALSARNSINLSEHGYENCDHIIDIIHEEIGTFSIEKTFEVLDANKTIIIMPIDRVHFEGRPFTHNCMLYPPNSINYSHFFKIEESLFGNGLRDVSQLTLFNIDTLTKNYCIAFNYDLNLDEFRSNKNHHDDITLLSLLSSSMSSLFDLIRFNECKFNLPDTLPAQIGTWRDSNDYIGALIYNKNLGAYLLSGSVEITRPVKGLGLEICSLDTSELQLLGLEDLNSEVSRVIKYALQLYSDALYSHNLTIKFIRIMTLFEYLAFPDEYKKFQDVKKQIICCIAKDKSNYHELSQRFKVLSEDYRTKIVHNGETIESLISDYDERMEFFNEIEMYLKKSINTMFSYKEKNWEEFITHRNHLIQTLTQ